MAASSKFSLRSFMMGGTVSSAVFILIIVSLFAVYGGSWSASAVNTP